MKVFEAKTLDDALALASKEFEVDVKDITYQILEEKKTLFTKKVVIECYCEKMVLAYIENYLAKILKDMQFECETVTYVQDNRIYCNLNTDHNSILIGKNGVILRAINTIVKQAVLNTFKKRMEISIDINGYKESRYQKVTILAKKLAKQVLRTKTDVKLDPLPADERKMIHQVISTIDHLKTESKGEGKNRYITISYVD